jgi:hypothetical protein
MIVKSYYIVLTSIFGRVRILSIAVFDSLATTKAFPLLDTVDMLRVIVYYSFIKDS